MLTTLFFVCVSAVTASSFAESTGHLSDRDLLLRALRQNDEQQTQINQLQAIVREQNAAIARIEGRKQRSRRAIGTVEAAFTASTINVLHNLANYEALKFQNVTANVGNHYNITDGTFTAPVSGYYVISASIMAELDSELLCEIALNNDISDSPARMYAKGSTNFHDQGSQTVVVHMKQGDRAFVRNQSFKGEAWGAAFSSFSGFLLYEDRPTSVVVG